MVLNHIRVHKQPQQVFQLSLPGRYPLQHLVWQHSQRYPYLLESTSGFDILFAFPQAQLCKQSGGAVLWQGLPVNEHAFLPALNRCWREQQQTYATPADLPFTGGWFVYLGYELAGEIEPRLQMPVAGSAIPVAQATRIPAAIIYDHHSNQTSLVAEPGYSDYLKVMQADLQALSQDDSVNDQQSVIELTEEPPDRYLQAISRVLEYIHAGDVFQVNLSRSWRGKLSDRKQMQGIHRRLRQTNPAPFGGVAQFERGVIVSSSPERLVRVRNGMVETRPIAGTRPRANAQQTDTQLQQELLAHPKERAEHIMLIDLERNDLGRICIPGSVKVNELMVLESYTHVHHIVSNIQGRLRDGITPAEVIRAVFPGGTITGCPKVRCMEIIAELEGTPRGAYTGSFGYLNHNGDMDLNILIRTLVLDNDNLLIRAGAGLVADSIPQRELEETRAKAKGMLLALQGN